MTALVESHATRPYKGQPALSQAEIEELLPEIPGWIVYREDDIPRLRKPFAFPNFSEALGFTNQVARLAEAEDHHPALLTEWGKVTITWWTHTVGGLHRNDFILAAKTDRLYAARSED